MELQRVMTQISARQQLAWIEVILPKMDMPELLSFVSKALEKRNSGQ